MLNWPFVTRVLPAPHPQAENWMWFRCPSALANDPGLHRVILSYASDVGLISAALRWHGLTPWTPGLRIASLDHALWIHGPFRADEWLLYDQISPSASGALGLSTARLFQHGALVSNVAQEGLIRPLRPRL